MAVLNSFSQIALTVFGWMTVNALVFSIPSLGWIRYSILMTIEVLIVLFVGCCIYDASNWKPWKEVSDAILKLRGGTQPRRVVLMSLSVYLKHFGSLAAIWSAEIIFQKVLFSKMFQTSVHVIDDGDEPLYWDDPSLNVTEEGRELTCTDGNVPFLVRQLGLLMIMPIGILLYRMDKNETHYLYRIFLPGALMAVFGGLSVYNGHSGSAVAVLLTFVWVFIRIARIMWIKWIQKTHFHTLSLTRFLRLFIPLMLLVMIPTFFITEYHELSSVVIRNPSGTYSDTQQFSYAIQHLMKVVMYTLLFFTGLMLLFYCGNGVDYMQWLTARDVIFSNICYIAIGESIKESLRTVQIVGLSFFMICWSFYILFYVMKVTWILR